MATHASYLQHPHESLNQVQRHYMQPLNRAERAARRFLFGLTWASVHGLLRFDVTGKQNLPAKPPFILAPSHTSSLDPFLLATAIPYHVMNHCHWAAAARAIMKNPFRRATNRLAGSVPIWRTRSALSMGVAVLEGGNNLIWFPEGHRTRSGQLQEFRPGIGMLAVHTQVPVLPIRILGGYQAMPPGKHFPRVGSRIAIRIGEPLQADDNQEVPFDQAADQFTQQLYQAMLALGS